MKRVALHTLGCKVNFTETSTIGRQFLDRGYRLVRPDEPFDVAVLNTCSVTGRADRECRQIIRRMRRSSPESYIIVTGCYAQLRPDEVAAIEGVDLVLGSREKLDIFSRADGFRRKPVPDSFVSCIDEAVECEGAHSGTADDRTRAFLKVQDGCDYTCSFCTIPLARGPSRSRPLDHVIRDAGRLAGEGFREIVLTGVNVGDYGRASGTGLLALLKAMEQVPGLDRVRISSVEPNLLTPAVVEFVLGSGRMCNHFHVPLQSGCDAVLRRMRRRSLTADYARLVGSIKSLDPGACIGADVLVGFPGESPAMFRETVSFLESIPVSYLHVFTYSERPGTPAASMPGAVSPRVRAERSEELRALGRAKRLAFHSGFVGSTVSVLVESSSPLSGHSGLTGNYLRVESPWTGAPANTLLPVRISSAGADTCSGVAAAGRAEEPTTVELQEELQ